MTFTTMARFNGHSPTGLHSWARSEESAAVRAPAGRATRRHARRSCGASCRSRAASRGATTARRSRSRTCCRSPRWACSRRSTASTRSSGHPFASFAVPTILGEMRRHFRDAGWSVHVPRGSQERALKVRDAQERLANERGRAPTVNELAEYLELSTEDDDRRAAGDPGLRVAVARRSAPGRDRRSDVLRRRDGRGGRALRARRARRDGQRGARADPAARARDPAACASSRISRRPRSPTRVGISQMQVSRLLRRSLDQLRALTDTKS